MDQIAFDNNGRIYIDANDDIAFVDENTTKQVSVTVSGVDAAMCGCIIGPSGAGYQKMTSLSVDGTYSPLDVCLCCELGLALGQVGAATRYNSSICDDNFVIDDDTFTAVLTLDIDHQNQKVLIASIVATWANWFNDPATLVFSWSGNANFGTSLPNQLNCADSWRRASDGGSVVVSEV